ncbi:translation machinery-associated protein 16 [Coniochaeta sp. 2T2.1]|nr:translation machinery-associated protein 16 [Coniochaeta sp. 2T2.1]
MPTTLEKARKHVNKKKGADAAGALHQFSRDSKRLQTAQIRDERLEKLARSRKKRDKPLLERVAFFQEVSRENGGKALDMATIQAKIQEFVNQYNEEYEEQKKARRPGRPASAREDLLKVAINGLETEWEKGFYLPDLTDEVNISELDRFEGSWAYLSNLKWVKITKKGDQRTSSFPPKA